MKNLNSKEAIKELKKGNKVTDGILIFQAIGIMRDIFVDESGFYFTDFFNLFQTDKKIFELLT